MNKNNILVIVLVVVIGMVAFWYMTNNQNQSSSTLTASTDSTQSSDAKYIYTILQEMAQVKLDDSIFSNPVFQNLKDNTVSFSPQPAGRNNPFSPTGTDLFVVGQTPTATTPASNR